MNFDLSLPSKFETPLQVWVESPTIRSTPIDRAPSIAERNGTQYGFKAILGDHRIPKKQRQ